MNQQPLFERVDTVFVVVEDFRKAIDWYKHKLGLKPVFQADGACALTTGETTPVTLIDASVLEEEHPIFNFYAADIQSAHQHLSSRGIQVGPIRDYGSMSTFDFRDLDGRLLNVCSF